MKSFNNQTTDSPTFSNEMGAQYFKHILREKHLDRTFQRPDWMPKIDSPIFPMIHDELAPNNNNNNNMTFILRPKMQANSKAHATTVLVLHYTIGLCWLTLHWRQFHSLDFDVYV